MAVSMRGPRAENQDNYLLIQPGGRAEYLLHEQAETRHIPGWGKQWWRLLLADGMGGHHNGREISETMIQLALDIKPVWEPGTLRQKLYTLHQQLRESFAQQHEQHSPGTTLVWVDVHISGLAVMAHVGDSRLYHWSAIQRTWRQATHDHTYQEFDWRVNTASPDSQSATSRPGLAQAMGYGSYGLLVDADGQRSPMFSPHLRLDLAQEMLPHARSHADIMRLRLQAGDALLLASDGLWATPQQTEPLLPPLNMLDTATGLDKLVWDTLAAEGRDNTTAVLLRPLKS